MLRGGACEGGGKRGERGGTLRALINHVSTIIVAHILCFYHFAWSRDDGAECNSANESGCQVIASKLPNPAQPDSPSCKRRVAEAVEIVSHQMIRHC